VVELQRPDFLSSIEFLFQCLNVELKPFVLATIRKGGKGELHNKLFRLGNRLISYRFVFTVLRRFLITTVYVVIIHAVQNLSTVF